MRVVLTVCYGLAATTAGLFHDHGRPGDQCHRAPAGVEIFHSHESVLDHGEFPSQQSVPPQSPLDGPQCLVCKFLAQKPLAACAVEEVASVAHVQTVMLAAPPQCSAPASLSWHSRAPPDAA
jgi:hypothetical protein